MTTQAPITPQSFHLANILKWKEAEGEQHKKQLLDLILTTEDTYKANKIKVSPWHTEVWLEKFITQDAQMLEMKQQVRQLATEDYPVLILGETGTGKELIANALHGWRKGKFVAINCTSLPDYLLESELFGHKKGAFTGALEDKIGLLQYAAQGTVFLDEIGDMPLQLQAKLLRVLQEKKIRRVGDNQEIPIDCRIVAATNQNLLNLINEECFRTDLYWRLCTFKLTLTPIRARLHDLIVIFQHLDKTLPYEQVLAEAREDEKSGFHALPGNVRELESIVARWKVFGKI